MKEVSDLIDLMRARGVAEFEGMWAGERVRLVLGPAPIAPALVPDEPKLPPPIRDDGLTKEQAEDLYWSSGG